MRREVFEAVRSGSEGRVEFGSADDEALAQVPASLPFRRLVKRAELLRWNEGRRGARVGVEVFDGIRLEVGVDHDHHAARLQDPEEGGHPLGPVGQRDHHALLRTDAGLHEQVGVPAREGLHVGVAQALAAATQGEPVTAPLLDAIIEEVVGDVEFFRWAECHGEVSYGGPESTATGATGHS